MARWLVKLFVRPAEISRPPVQMASGISFFYQILIISPIDMQNGWYCTVFVPTIPYVKTSWHRQY